MKIHYLEKILEPFENKGFFEFDGCDLKTACNAAKDKPGVYIFYDASKEEREIIYIGCCGFIKNDGGIAIRKSGGGGFYGRIVNGHQFEKAESGKKLKRHISIPLQMKNCKIDKMEIEWYVTFEGKLFKSPGFVESCLLQTYFEKHRRLPKWNKKF